MKLKPNVYFLLDPIFAVARAFSLSLILTLAVALANLLPATLHFKQTQQGEVSS